MPYLSEHNDSMEKHSQFNVALRQRPAAVVVIVSFGCCGSTSVIYILQKYFLFTVFFYLFFLWRSPSVRLLMKLLMRFPSSVSACHIHLKAVPVKKHLYIIFSHLDFHYQPSVCIAPWATTIVTLSKTPKTRQDSDHPQSVH